MKKISGLIMMFLCTASIAAAGEIYGTIRHQNRPAAGVRVEITVAGQSRTTTTDSYGAYKSFVNAEGKGTIRVHFKNKALVHEIYSYADSKRYNFQIVGSSTDLRLRRD